MTISEREGPYWYLLRGDDSLSESVYPTASEMDRNSGDEEDSDTDENKMDGRTKGGRSLKPSWLSSRRVVCNPAEFHCRRPLEA